MGGREGFQVTWFLCMPTPAPWLSGSFRSFEEAQDLCSREPERSAAQMNVQESQESGLVYVQGYTSCAPPTWKRQVIKDGGVGGAVSHRNDGDQGRRTLRRFIAGRGEELKQGVLPRGELSYREVYCWETGDGAGQILACQGQGSAQSTFLLCCLKTCKTNTMLHLSPFSFSQLQN